MNAEIEKEVLKCVQVIREEGFAVFPSEIGWTIACDASDKVNVESILNSPDYLFHAILLNDHGKLSKFAKNIPDAIYDLVEFSSKPLHLIIDEVINSTSVSADTKNEIPFRIVKDEFSLLLTGKFGKPIFAAVNASSDHPNKTDTVLNKKCYVVNLRAGAKANTSNLVVVRLLKNEKFEIIRK